MKKTLCLLLLVIVIFTSCGTKESNGFTNSTNSKVSTSTTNETTDEVSEDVDMNSNINNAESVYNENMKKEYDSIIAKINDDTFDNVITKSMPQSIGNYLMYRYDPIKSYQVTPVKFDYNYKIEFIRKINNQRMYTIHKTGSNGLFYSFFEGENISGGSLLRNTVYVCKKLNKK